MSDGSGGASLIRRRDDTEIAAVVPGGYDGITARLAAAHPFDGVFIGSYATAATRFGAPDIGFVGLGDLEDQLHRLRPLLPMPVIVDAEGGFGNPIHVVRTVRVLERAGADVIQLEDQEFGKHIFATAGVVPLPLAIDKIHAALDARAADETRILFRTDGLRELGVTESIDRVAAFAEAGAHAVMIADPDIPESLWPRLRSAVDVPILAMGIPGSSPKEMRQRGIDVVIQFSGTHDVAAAAVARSFASIARGDDVRVDGTMSMQEFDDFLGVAEIRESAHRTWPSRSLIP